VISLIIPTFNEEVSIGRTLGAIERVRGQLEVIVVDGSSSDETVAAVRAMIPGYSHPLRVIVAERNRALRQNRAASESRGEVLVFLHADTLVPADAVEKITSALQDERIVGGNFALIFEGDSWVESFFTWVYRVRRPFGIYYGDSGIFARRKVFKEMGGFMPFPIMDDYEFVRRLERCGRTVCLPTSMRTSNRRWRVQGLVPTLWSWVWIQTLYSLGVPARTLARWYRPVRERTSDSRENLHGVMPAARTVLRPGK
jgi:rSAM/selenodomain-associated transferase 2